MVGYIRTQLKRVIPSCKVCYKPFLLQYTGLTFRTRYTMPELEKTQGHIVFVTSLLAQLRIPTGSSYSISKHSLNRLAEFVHIGMPGFRFSYCWTKWRLTLTFLDHGDKGVKAYSIHPGGILTDLGESFLDENPGLRSYFIDTPELSAWTEGRTTRTTFRAHSKDLPSS